MSGRTLLLTAAAITAATTVVAPSAQAQPVAAASVAAPALTHIEVARMSVRQLRVLAPRTRVAVAHHRVDGPVGYQGQRRCMGGVRPGTRSIARLLHNTYSNAITTGLSRRCGGDTSEHYDGRAIDWMVNSANPRQAAMGDAFTHWLTKRTDGVVGGNARRLGVMYVIWRGRMWRSYSPGWRDYQGCTRRGGDPTSCHRNHVHISLNWRGAYKHTSWWTAH